MMRALWFLCIITLAVFALGWLLDRPGTVVFDWLGYRVETSIAVLLGIVSGIVFATAQGYRIWLFLRRAPSQLMEAWRQRRKQQGYKALTKGMVAVSAGDAEEALRSVKRAEVLLNEPPLTMLLSAQAAQLNGDEKAAENFFNAMVEDPETEFLGIRGLLGQAVKRDDTEEALSLALRAHQLKPKSEWAAKNLFSLQTRESLWLDARITAETLIQNKMISKSEAKSRKAVLYYLIGLDAKSVGEDGAALDLFKKAANCDLTFAPAIGSYADALIKKNQKKKALMLIEKTWCLTPHPSLLEIYWRACGDSVGLERVHQTDQLCKLNSSHIESKVARVRAHLDLALWGEVRHQLESIVKQVPEALDSRICYLWAELEEGEHGDMMKAHAWLSRASSVDSQAAWVCSDCGNTVSDWMASCGNCASFNTFSWRRPLNVLGLRDQSSASSEKGLSVIPSLKTNLTAIN